MNSKLAYNKYKQTAVQSASREKILLMLYEGAIKFTKLALVAAEQKKIGPFRGHFQRLIGQRPESFSYE